MHQRCAYMCVRECASFVNCTSNTYAGQSSGVWCMSLQVGEYISTRHSVHQYILHWWVHNA